MIQREEICYRYRAKEGKIDQQTGGIADDDRFGRPLKRVEEMRWQMSDLARAELDEKAGPNERIEAFPLRNPLSSVKLDGAQAEASGATPGPALEELRNDPGFEFKSKKKRALLEKQHKRSKTRRDTELSEADEADETGHGTFSMTLTGVEKSLLKLEQLELDIKQLLIKLSAVATR